MQAITFKKISQRKTSHWVLLLLSLLISCQRNHDKRTDNNTSDPVGKEVRQMAANIASDLSAKGPVAWLDYFEKTPNFFMASEGVRVFANNDSATRFVKDILAKNIVKINLNWTNVSVDSLSPVLANLSANFHEDLFDKADQKIPADGYFTGIAEKTPEGWKLRNLHWSLLKK